MDYSQGTLIPFRALHHHRCNSPTMKPSHSECSSAPGAKYRDLCKAAGYGFLPFFFFFVDRVGYGCCDLVQPDPEKFFVSQDADARTTTYIFTRVSFAISKTISSARAKMPKFQNYYLQWKG
ncbi:unnamed protein product [Linum trigynum]|uniref:Uncharacterized protein n=1 Tax=Linum trigynum TaxID=586398 RepID=A0AAV2GVE9_9ROSI